MATISSDSLIDTLRQHQLLNPQQLAGLATVADAKTLAKELMQRGWLTAYQANLLLQGRGQELVLGSYFLLERLGEGGMGQVFKARHRKLERIVAIKLIRKERLESADAVRRFEREVRAVAALAHPNIVHAFDADNIDGTHLLVMEYIEGANDLAKLVKKNGPLPVPQACDFIRQAALGLQHACERGLVHRDIKPANLLLTADGKTVKVLDMGLARLDSATTDDKTSTMTQEGAIMGTPDYIAPEQALESHTVDIRGDLYSLGCTFYFLLTGRVPFPGGTLLQKLNKHQFEEPQPIEQLRSDVPQDVAKLVRKLMAKKPSDRYQTPAELATALAAVSHQSSFAVAAVAKGPTIAKQAEADTLASAFAYMAKRDDTVGFEPVQKKPKNRRWLMAGAAVGLVGLAVLAFLFFKNPSSENKPPAKPNVPVQANQKDPPKYFTNSIGMKFVWIPPGTFMMGSPEREEGRRADEIQHKVTLTKGFYISAYEVTQEQWETVMDQNPSMFKGEKNLPVEQVSWNACQEFVKKLREKDKKPLRLPTEAEWEYACRAGTKTKYYFGDDAETLSEYAWSNVNSSGKTHPVGQKKPNAFGLHDTHGNVGEWCQDLLGDYPQEDVVDPQGSSTGSFRVLRGGSWGHPPVSCRSADRNRDSPGNYGSLYGFRLCFCLEQDPPKHVTNSIGMKFGGYRLGAL